MCIHCYKVENDEVGRILSCTCTVLYYMQNRESTDGYSKTMSGKITTSSEKDWSKQVEHMQVPKGRDQVSGGVSVPCRHATPVANVLWKLLKIR